MDGCGREEKKEERKEERKGGKKGGEQASRVAKVWHVFSIMKRIEMQSLCGQLCKDKVEELDRWMDGHYRASDSWDEGLSLYTL